MVMVMARLDRFSRIHAYIIWSSNHASCGGKTHRCEQGDRSTRGPVVKESLIDEREQGVENSRIGLENLVYECDLCLG